MIQIVEGKANQIIKRNGSSEIYNPEKMYKVILWACEGSKILADELLQAIDIKIHNKMKIEILFDEVIATASNKISDLYPIWEKVAKNLYELKLHKEMGFLRDDYPSYSYIFDANEEAGLYHTSWREILDLEELSAAIDPSYDKLFTFGGLNVFVDKYCNKSKGKLLELPQHTYMRVAIQLMYKDGTDAIIEKYLQLAKHEVTEATPKMVNSMRWKASMFSCCLVRPSDSQEGINESVNMLSKESKYSGGCAWDSSLLRGPGSKVEGNNGSSGGAIPFIQELQWTVGGYNQG